MLTEIAKIPPETLIITALLPLTASMLVTQVNPYHALVMRGILGAVAALVYALFGAADVALTEALVGTMLSITLYAVAVRSSMSFRLGVLETHEPEAKPSLVDEPAIEAILPALRERLKRHQLRLELVTYPTTSALEEAIAAKTVHAIHQPEHNRIYVRLPQLHQLLHPELPTELV